MRGKLVLVMLVSLAACRGGEKAKRHRAGSGAAVEIVTQVQLPDAGHAGSGATTEEVEPNDAIEVATPLALGSTVRARIDPDTDVDAFRIDVDQRGALSVMVSGVEGVDLVLEIQDDSGNLLAKSDRGTVRVKEGVPNLGVSHGRYIAVVHAAPKKKAAPPPRPKKGRKAPDPAPEAPAARTGNAPVYEITATMVPVPANGEHEPDDDRGTANDLILADTATGYVGWSGDADVWKLSVETLSARNAIDVEVGAVEGVALELEVADGIGQPLVTRKAPKGAPLVLRGLLPVVPPGGAPFHYLTVRGDKSNPETPYNVHVTAHVVGTDAEIEPDDSPDKPFPIPPDRTIVHGTWTPGDVDCYGIAVSDQPRTVEAIVQAKGTLALAAEILVDGKPAMPPVASAGKGPAKKGTPAAADRASAQVPAGAHVVIRVRAIDPNATAEGEYDLSVQESGATGDNAP